MIKIMNYIKNMQNNNVKSKLDDLKKQLESEPESNQIEQKKEKQKLEKLNDQHLTFIQEYIITKDQTQAAINAGYSKKSAKTKGSLLMADPLIQEELKRQQDIRKEKWQIDQDFIINEYMQQILYSKELSNDGTDKVKDSNLWLKATQSLSKTLGLDAPNKVDITSNGKSININYITPKDEEEDNTDE